MKNPAKSLQQQLEQLEAGKPVDACLADLSQDEADLLRTAVLLREVEFPKRDSETVAAQRTNLLKLAAKEKNVKSKLSQGAEKAEVRSRRNRLMPLAALSGAVALLFICAFIAAVGAGLAWRSYRNAQVARQPSPAPTSAVIVQKPTPSSTPAIASRNPSPSPGATSEAKPAQSPTPEPARDPSPSPTDTSVAEPAQNPTPEPAEESTRGIFFPHVSMPEIRDPQHAVLKDPQGLVQVQASDGTWTAVRGTHAVTAGQRIRTGALSSARLAFYDGSQAQLGPDTEVSIDELNARTSDGPRVVALTQWIGETDHDVAPAGDAGSRYEVRTPSASGEAKGTSFRVVVTSIELSHFIVDEGSVAVTSLNVTVVVVAGQSTTIGPGQPPGEPFFRITGEGEVSQIGTTWTIAGQTFETNENTVIIGHPQIGDRVFVEGHLLPDGTRVADRIVLLRRSPLNRFTIRGRVDTIADAMWTVADQAINVNDDTTIEGGIQAGDLVTVDGVILEDGTLLAEHIALIEEAPGLPFNFVGVVQDTGVEAWQVSGIAIAIDADTEISEGLVPGDIVRVRGWILDDETWLARSIERIEDEERAFRFTGYVESMTPWIVSGIAFETREWTDIETGIELGDRVRVRGRILEDGTWVASEIARLDEGEELYVVFVGTVDSTAPWIVSGMLLAVDDETVVQGDISVGDRARVKARILPDGTWLAKRITRIGTWPGLGCLSFTAMVVGIDGHVLLLPNGETIPLGEDVVIEGEVAVDSIIIVFVCVDADGTITVVAIVVIYQPPPVIVPWPTRPPGDDDDKVTICHKPDSKKANTITISRSAVQSHLEHGDTLGPCPDHDDDDHHDDCDDHHDDDDHDHDDDDDDDDD